jgi:hypothetical protein
MDENDKPITMSVPDAGKKYFGLGRAASYQAADLNHIPTIRIGRRRRAIVAAIEARIAEAGAKSA